MAYDNDESELVMRDCTFTNRCHVCGADRAPAQWSTTPPTEPCFCWVRLRGNNYAEGARVDVREATQAMRVAVFGDDWWQPLENVELWGPKLTPPPLPEEAKEP